MNLQELKKLNNNEEVAKAEKALLKPYYPTVMAIPQEHWEAITFLLTEQSKNNLLIQKNIKDFPQWSNINENLIPSLNKLLKYHKSDLTENKKSIEDLLKTMNINIEKNVNNLVVGLIQIQTEEMNTWAKTIISKLQARDLSPVKQRLTWVGVGVLISIVFYGLLALFKVV